MASFSEQSDRTTNNDATHQQYQIPNYSSIQPAETFIQFVNNHQNPNQANEERTERAMKLLIKTITSPVKEP